jgi:hypothetical protein
MKGSRRLVIVGTELGRVNRAPDPCLVPTATRAQITEGRGGPTTSPAP